MSAKRIFGSVASTCSGLSLRLGAVFLGLTILLALLAGIAPRLEPGPARIPWLLALAAATVSGFACLRVGRVPAKIEGELLRTGGDPQAWRTIRPLIGDGQVVEAWNVLVEQAHGRRETDSEHAPTTSPDNQVALMARAMRSVAAGIAVTGDDFRITAANPPLAALLGRDEAADLKGQNLLELLALAASPQAAGLEIDGTDAAATGTASTATKAPAGGSPQATSPDADSGENEEAVAAIRRLAGGANAVTVRLTCAAPPAGPDGASSLLPPPQNVWRISRTRLDGRDGDSQGFAWLIQDITQQTLATAARDQFLQTAAHELRTPLSNLRAYAEALSIEEGVGVEEQKEFCNIINDETTRLSRLVDHLLTVGQMEAGSLVVHQHIIEPARIIDEAVEYLRPQIAASQLTLHTDISPKLRLLRGDKDKIQATLINLIGNAVKYTPEGGHVWVRAAIHDDTLEIAVEDDGIGISPEDLPRVFEKFFRANEDSVQGQRGNGLGLAFAREVARLHQGDITAESRIGEGSVFTLRLPAPDEPTSV